MFSSDTHSCGGRGRWRGIGGSLCCQRTLKSNLYQLPLQQKTHDSLLKAANVQMKVDSERICFIVLLDIVAALDSRCNQFSSLASGMSMFIRHLVAEQCEMDASLQRIKQRDALMRFSNPEASLKLARTFSSSWLQF